MKRKLAENFKRVEWRIAEACERADRSRSSVTLLPVTKSAGLDVIRTLVDMGITDFAENRMQELTKRAAIVG